MAQEEEERYVVHSVVMIVVLRRDRADSVRGGDSNRIELHNDSAVTRRRSAAQLTGTMSEYTYTRTLD